MVSNNFAEITLVAASVRAGMGECEAAVHSSFCISGGILARVTEYSEPR